MSAAYSSFRPGREWTDTEGKPIVVHGGSVLPHDGWFYWYGENKEKTDGSNGIWNWGIRFYRSKDLYNWEDLGLVIPPDLDDASSPMHPAQFTDRPHIVHNPATGKFVCWIKVMASSGQTRSVLVADTILGPYRLLARDMMPFGMSAGDFDVVTSPDDGKGYMYFERVHSELICADLDSEYTGFTGYYSTHFPRPGPPSVREAPAYFYRQGRHYLATSGTTGYFPNPSEIAVADTFHGPWTRLGDLHPTDGSRTSFNSQISCIFKHPAKRDLYIAMADRWMGEIAGPEFESGRLSELVQAAYGKSFSQPRQDLDRDEEKAFAIAGTLAVNTAASGHVWLPIDFSGAHPTIRWQDEWFTEDFD
jgi:hypothetical protein